MLTGSDTELLEINGWTTRIRRPTDIQSQKVFLLLHGWTGNENVMWVFAHHFPRDAWVLSPRGIYPSAEGGYGWTETRGGLDATIRDFFPAVERVTEWLHQWAAGVVIHQPDLTLIGFSQGAALSYSIGLTRSMPVRRIAGLAGFVPRGENDYTQNKPLTGVPVFIAHGTNDDTVPIDRAREAVKVLQLAGARVTYCESEVGHKLGANCLHSLDEFISLSTPK